MGEETAGDNLICHTNAGVMFRRAWQSAFGGFSLRFGMSNDAMRCSGSHFTPRPPPNDSVSSAVNQAGYARGKGADKLSLSCIIDLHGKREGESRWGSFLPE